MPRPRDIEDTNNDIYGFALEVLHPEHKTFRLWSSAWDIAHYNLLRENMAWTGMYVNTAEHRRQRTQAPPWA
ncbi:hypothetical protein PAXRUDRAFT_830220 [Paxillus rubicundulus Ve08.2h10]|uniref:Uncharacterized protein n=1 Tax=Paxillus rubicundulus Ve08.2h10 TaxID=930991 RepID=A0A0D0DTU4_9AGAM|nr:hypothetical protein PAXRUDRAFT_830220 [Paxillus rubicundulus Ve08.2h10]